MQTVLIQAIFEVWDNISEWIILHLTGLVDLFWTANGDGGGSLTFFGVLAVVGLGISVIFLLMRIIQNFLHLRG